MSKGTYPILLSLQRIEMKIMDKAHSNYIVNINRRYLEFCNSIRQLGYPASYISVAGFISMFVEQHNGSSKSINNIISAIHVMCHYINVKWLSDADTYQLNKIKKQLHLNDTIAIKRRSPIILGVIRHAIINIWNLNNMVDLLIATMSLCAHNGLLRAQDLFSGIKVKNVSWNFENKSVTIHMKPGKVAKDGSGFKVYIKDFLGPSFYKFIHQWFNINKLWYKNELYIFPKIIIPTKTFPNLTMDFNQNASRPWFHKQIMNMLSSLNMDSSLYSLHSFRAGGATDLFMVGIPYPKIQKYGRWKSDAALVYYRDEMEIATSVAIAFGSGVNNNITNNEYF